MNLESNARYALAVISGAHRHHGFSDEDLLAATLTLDAYGVPVEEVSEDLTFAQFGLVVRRFTLDRNGRRILRPGSDSLRVRGQYFPDRRYQERRGHA